MPKVNFRLEEALHLALMRRARAANLPLSRFIRQVLEQAIDERKCYVFSSQDEILATTSQILAILATSVGRRSPEALEQGIVSPPPFLPARVRALFPQPNEDAPQLRVGDEKTPDDPVELDEINAEANGAGAKSPAKR